MTTQRNQAPVETALFEPGVQRRVRLLVEGGDRYDVVPGTNITLSEFQRYQLRGRQLQARAMAEALMGLARAVAWPLQKLARALGRWHAHAEAARQLGAMDDHLLQDIGIRREDIPAAVAGLMSRRAAVDTAPAPRIRQPDRRQPACNQPQVRAAA